MKGRESKSTELAPLFSIDHTFRHLFFAPSPHPDIPFDVTDWALDEMIEAALGTSGMLVTRYGICTRYDWYIEWKENPGLKELSSIDDSGLTFDG